MLQATSYQHSMLFIPVQHWIFPCHNNTYWKLSSTHSTVPIYNPTHTQSLSWLNSSTAACMYGCCMWKVLLFHGQFLLISHTAMNLRSHPQKQSDSTATVHLRIQATMNCNGKQSPLLEMTWLLCTLHSLTIHKSAVVLCLMCQIPVAILSSVYWPHTS